MVNRVLKYGLVAVACIIPALIGSSPANAVSWDQKMSNGKICRVLVTPHYHTGIGVDRHSKRAAQAAAVRCWKGFTVWEYGTA
jgi:hypothetical protein